MLGIAALPLNLKPTNGDQVYACTATLEHDIDACATKSIPPIVRSRLVLRLGIDCGSTQFQWFGGNSILFGHRRGSLLSWSKLCNEIVCSRLLMSG